MGRKRRADFLKPKALMGWANPRLQLLGGGFNLRDHRVLASMRNAMRPQSHARWANTRPARTGPWCKASITPASSSKQTKISISLTEVWHKKKSVADQPHKFCTSFQISSSLC